MSNKNRGSGPAPITTQSPAPQNLDQGTEDLTTTQEPEATQAPETTEAPAVTEAPTEAPQPTTPPAPPATQPIAPAPVPTAAPVAAPAEDEAELPFETRIDAALPQLSPESRALVEFLRSYRVAMQIRTAVDNKTMTQQQQGLWKAIRNLITSAPDFQVGFSILIAYFREYGAAEFREQSVFRAMDLVPLSADELTAFQRILNLLTLASRSPSHEMTLRQVDLNKTLNEAIYGDEGRNRVIAYFRG